MISGLATQKQRLIFEGVNAIRSDVKLLGRNSKNPLGKLYYLCTNSIAKACIVNTVTKDFTAK